MKSFIAILLISIFFAVGVRAQTNLDNDPKTISMYDVEPIKSEGISLSTALLMDLIIPGGGHFYTNNIYVGYLFASLKLFSIYCIYYSYREWIYRRSLYSSAQHANEQIDPLHELEFELPEGGYNTVEEFHRDYDRAAQKITFSVLGTVVVYVVSGIVVYHNVQKINIQRIPTFEVSYAGNICENEKSIMLFITRRF